MQSKQISVSSKGNNILAVSGNSSMLLPVDMVKKLYPAPLPTYQSLCTTYARVFYEILGGDKDSLLSECTPTANGFIVNFKPN